MKRELTPNEVLFNVDLNEDDDNKIRLKDIPEITSAYEKIKRAISIDEEGYNLYIIDSFSKDKLENNDPKRPEPIFLTNGKGAKLKETIENIKNSYYEVAMEFYNTSSESEKDRIIDEVHSKRTNYIGELMEMAKIDGFDVKATNGGFAFIPLKEGEAMTEKEYDELSEESKDSIVLKASNLKKKAEVVLEKLKDIELTSMKKLKGIYAEFMDVEMEDEKEDCLLNFIDDDDAYEYLEKVFYSIEKELVDCYTMNVEDDESDINEVLDKYDISVLVDNTNNKNPRVIYEEDPNVTNLFGNIEYENHNGLYSTDLSLINSGSMLQANEGCIIIRLNQLAMNNYSYYYLKKTLMSGKVSIDSSRGYLDIISINGVKPKAVPINVKVILIGDYESYDILYNADEDFKSLFPIRVEFSNYVKNQPIKGKVLKDYILERGKKHYINKVSDDAIKEIIKYLSRVAECRGKICIEDKNIDRLLILANNMAELDGREIISDKDIRNVAYEKSLIEDEILEMYEDSKIILTLSGEKVGAINGLAVLSSGYYTFGKPMRLTCVACKGEGKILDIQKESNMSGSIHEKSINILSGLLSNLIIPYEKLPVDFHLSFEQTYGQIDGDSASVAEILCILSALSKVGIKQNIAVTGSINQFGEVQAIGGVNEKIEGFYKVCKLLGDSKDKGVLIPITNSEDLVLNKEVEEAIEKGEFHIYTMENLQDAIEVMMLDSKTSYKDLFKIIEKEVEKYKGKSK
ncbi:MAG: AAA family ATPase [Clostridium sp.]|uniref:AAA family ATPase n=1 Tax=Clostridium sp. TaxID=1506 RepID=UPI002900CF74|nr:AAA family ATPase [Clostridium sp.]MDU2107460.1 AAA family ATPase [Clostridium sp.]